MRSRCCRRCGPTPSPPRPAAGRRARADLAPVSPAGRRVERLLPFLADEPGHQIDLIAPLELHVLEDLLRVRRAELRPEHRVALSIECRGVPRRIEPELPEPNRRPLPALQHPDRRGHVHELDRVVERGGVRRRQRTPVGCRPPAVGRAHEHPAPRARAQLDLVDLRRGFRHDAGRDELDELLALPELARDDHRDQEAQREEGRGGTEEPAGPTYRRLHHTTAPTATTPSGRRTSTTRKIRCICDFVRRTSGGTGIRRATAGVRSSRTSQRTIARARSLLAMYGRKELLAKSPSPTTTSRKGRDPGGAPGHVPSKAAPSVRRPGRLATAATGDAGLARPG